jgi:hypothetical protein
MTTQLEHTSLRSHHIRLTPRSKPSGQKALSLGLAGAGLLVLVAPLEDELQSWLPDLVLVVASG